MTNLNKYAYTEKKQPTKVGAGLVRFGCNRKDNRKTRPYKRARIPRRL
ncbi:MAG: hypothetical protein RIG63_09230 [Coleofasciculus chthonoplastes F3-SA18-01]